MTSSDLSDHKKAGPNKEYEIENKPGFAVPFATVVFVMSLFFATNADGVVNVLGPGVVLSLYSGYGFLSCGKKIINASSIASYGVLMFVGFPSIYGGLGLLNTAKSFTPQSIIVGLILAFLFQSAIIFFSRRGGHSWDYECDLKNSIEWLNPHLIRSITRLSIFMLVCAVVSKAFGLGALSSGFSWISMLSATLLLFSCHKLGSIVKNAIIIIMAFMVKTGFSVGGFGRLNLAVLALSLAVVGSISLAVVGSIGLRSWLVKLGTIIMTGPALFFLIQQRLAFLEVEREGNVNEEEGIGSIVGPFHSAGTIIEAIHNGLISPTWGSSIFASATIWIPRAWWEDKPVGFGRAIVELTQPGLASSKTHSDAGTFIGEAVWNFGLWGAPVYLILLAYLIHCLDKRLKTSVFSGLRDYESVIFFLMMSLLSGSLLNLLWGSTSTLAARTLIPMAILFFMWMLGPKSTSFPTWSRSSRVS